jgi:CubicO group peptidase (beta-lactamase class C family)
VQSFLVRLLIFLVMMLVAWQVLPLKVGAEPDPESVAAPATAPESAAVPAPAPGSAATPATAPESGSEKPLALTAENLAGVVDPLMNKWREQHKGPGAVVVVVTRDRTVFARGYGFADIQAKRPFTADSTLVRPGSISKLFTGIAAMQLVEAGKLDLDRNVNDYLDFVVPTPKGGVPVTMRLLLTHRAGFEEHARDLFSHERNPEPLGRWLAHAMPPRLFPAGDTPAYSNYGAALAGYVVERVSKESFDDYVQRHILDPLGMNHSTFKQPLPENLAAMMAKGYRTASKPPLPFFETIVSSPAGALSASGEDMGRFMRALLNGGELDGVRILSQKSLDEMMAPRNQTAAGYLGLFFYTSNTAGRHAIGHNGGTMTFFSDLQLFRQPGVGVFTCLDGMGEIKEAEDIPDPTHAIAERFLPAETDDFNKAGALPPTDPAVAGVYHSTRRADSTFLRLVDLLSERDVSVDAAGNATTLPAIWPFVKGMQFKHIGPNLYEGPRGMRLYLEGSGTGNPRLVMPAMEYHKVPSSLNAKVIVPALLASLLVALLTLLCWPIAALLRRRSGKPFSEDRTICSMYTLSRLVLLIDLAAVALLLAICAQAADPTNFNAGLDWAIITLYGVAWCSVPGAFANLWIAVQFWQRGAGGSWARIYHSLIAASAIVIAWFFVTFHIAGTTLNY